MEGRIGKSVIQEEMRVQILKTSIGIAKREGWSALSIRRIAVAVRFTPPALYQYFKNKDSILTALTGIGFRRLTSLMKKAGGTIHDPFEKLERMWMAYWNFAILEKEFYQLMFGLGISCCHNVECAAGFESLSALMIPIIREIEPGFGGQRITDRKFIRCWATIHGLIAINWLQRSTSHAVSDLILAEAIRGIRDD